MGRMDRRQFLKGAAAAAAAAGAGVMGAPWVSRGAAAAAPSNRLAVGLIGVGIMGRGHLRRLIGDPGVQLVAVCEVDASRRDEAKATADEAYAAASPAGRYAGCAAYNDYRELLARRDIDAVVIVTPDHWHTLQSIDAAKAGKDVYCEKPICVTIDEGRQLARTMKRYGRVFQTGTQYRSIPTIRRVCRFVREGGLGKVKSAFALLDPIYWFLKQERYAPVHAALDVERYRTWYNPIEFAVPGEPVTPGLDWDLWVGPAPWRPFNRAYHVNPMPGVVPWSFSDAFGTASLTWHLSHSTDVIQWALGMEEGGPVELLHPADGGPYPTLTARYANGTLLHFVDHWGMVMDVYGAVPKGSRLAGNFGGIFVGERGWVTSMSAGGPVEGAPASIFEEMGMGRSREVAIGANDHHANWFECVRNRTRPSCDEEIGHRSASLGLLALIAHRLRRSLRWDPVREEFIGDDAANRLRSRPMRGEWRM